VLVEDGGERGEGEEGRRVLMKKWDVLVGSKLDPAASMGYGTVLEQSTSMG